jgi:hypothetical protein
VFGFFAGAIENRTNVRREMRGRLQEQGRLADPRLAAEQHQRPRHDAAAQDAVELADPRGDALSDNGVDVLVQLRTAAAERTRCTARLHRLARLLFNERIPRAAVVALPHPLGRLGTAGLTDVNGLGRLHE